MKKIILKESCKYAKIIDSDNDIVVYKDRPTEVPDDYVLEDTMKIYGEKEKPVKKKKSSRKKK